MAATWYRHTLFFRAENAAKDELFLPPEPAGRQAAAGIGIFSWVMSMTFPVADHLALGLGAMGTVDALPAAIEPAYGGSPVSSMVFTRLKIF